MQPDAGLKYPNFVSYVRETPWAMRQAELHLLKQIVKFRADGGKLSKKEIRAAVGAGPGRQVGYIAGTVAVIPISGVIMPRASLFTQYSGGTSLQDFTAALRTAASNDQVAAILLDVNSPGGSTDMVPETAALIRAINDVKPVSAIANTMAASAGYWLACQAGEFSVTPSGWVGSIGVFAEHDDFSGQLEQAGIDVTLISAGKYKTEGNPYEPLGEEAKAAIQGIVDEFYGMFVADVAAGRKAKTGDVVNGFGEGRMVTASNAVDAGMVDRVETFDAAFARAAGGTAPAGQRRALLDPITPAAELETGSDKPDEATDLEAWELGLHLHEQLIRKEH